MIDNFPEKIQEFLNNIRKFPGISKKTAEKILFHILAANKDETQKIIESINFVSTNIKNCIYCNNFAEENTDVCYICNSKVRNTKIISVVSSLSTLYAIEKIGKYKGLYFNLNEEIDVKTNHKITLSKIEMLKRTIKHFDCEEIILATNPTIGGELTAKAIKKEFDNSKVQISRIAYGLPLGSEIDYADEFSLMHSIENRKKL